MKTAGVKELKARLSGYLREVKHGETVLVTEHGRVVAELTPPGAGADRHLPPDERRVRRLMDAWGIAPPRSVEGDVPSPPARPVMKRGAFARLLDEERGEAG